MAVNSKQLMRSRAEAAWSNNDRSLSIAGLFDGKCMLMFLHCWSSMAAKWLFQQWLRCMNKTPKHKKRPCSLYGWLTRLILRQNKKQGNKEKTTTTKHTSKQRLLFIKSLRNISQRKCMNHFLTLMSFQTHMTYFLLLNTEIFWRMCWSHFPMQITMNSD